MISYVRQIAVCEPVLEMIKRAITESDNAGIRAKIIHIPTKESVLRAVSVNPEIDTEEKLRDFTIEHVLISLQLTEIEKERLNLSS
jgi:vacuolar-type H+-ATPase subunit F/Vma7